MAEAPRLLRFCGRLWETMKFERETGWETTRALHRPREGDGEYQIDLLSFETKLGEGKLLVSVSPLVDFDRVCSPGTEVRRTRVVCYVPFHEQAEELVFRRGELVIHRERIPANPPVISLEGVKRIDEQLFELSWTARHPEKKPLTFRVACLVDLRRGFLLAKDLEETHFVADLADVPGGKEVRFGILASDGIRSDYVLSEPLAAPEKLPRIWIQSPDPSMTYSPDQPLNLIGQATDVAGASFPDAGLVWRFDGKEIAKGTRLSLSPSAKPGKHQVTLEYVSDGKILAEQTVGVNVARRNDHHKAYLQALDDLKGTT